MIAKPEAPASVSPTLATRSTVAVVCSVPPASERWLGESEAGAVPSRPAPLIESVPPTMAVGPAKVFDQGVGRLDEDRDPVLHR